MKEKRHAVDTRMPFRVAQASQRGKSRRRRVLPRRRPDVRWPVPVTGDIEQKLQDLEIAFIHGRVLIVPVARRRT